MTRQYLIEYLTSEGCYPDEYQNSDVGELWHNCINGESCYVPYVDWLAITTFCHIFYELRIDPPLDYDTYYHIYLGFREHEVQKNQT